MYSNLNLRYMTSVKMYCLALKKIIINVQNALPLHLTKFPFKTKYEFQKLVFSFYYFSKTIVWSLSDYPVITTSVVLGLEF